MSEIVKFPDDARADPDRELTVDQHLRRGPSAAVLSSGSAIARWHGFDPAHSAKLCALCQSFEQAVALWTDHIKTVRGALAERGLDAEEIEKVTSGYTAEVRREFQAFKSRKMTLGDMMVETVLDGSTEEVARYAG